MYALIAGGGKVGSNVLRTLLRLGHEATLIEQRRDRYDRLEEEFEHQVQHGDATEIYVLERAGIERPPDIVLAVTGDDEDNIVICQIAREKYGVDEGDRARERPAQPGALRPARRSRRRSRRPSSIMALIEHEVPEHELVHLLELRKENLEIVEVQIDKRLAVRRQARRAACGCPDGARLISVMRDGAGGDRGRLDRACAPATRCSRSSSPGKELELRKVLLQARDARAGVAWRRWSRALLAARLAARGGEPRREARAPEAQTLRARLAVATRPRLARARRRAAQRAAAGSTSSSRSAASASSRTAALRAEPFLDIRGAGRAGGEQGLLSVAFHPSYAQNRRFYVNYTDRNGDTRVVEYRSNGRRALPGDAPAAPLRPTSRTRTTTAASSPSAPTARSTSGIGDGGAGGDPENRAQDPAHAARQARARSTSTAAARGRRSSALGLRNPWRFSFDRAHRRPLHRRRRPERAGRRSTTCRGAARASRTTAGTSTRAARGSRTKPHRRRAARRSRSPSTAARPGLLGDRRLRLPRQRRCPAPRGRYFYGDYCSGTIWSLRVVGGKATERPARARSASTRSSSFGEDARGELYATSLGRHGLPHHAC